MASVAWEQATKRFGSFVALQDFSLEGNDGEFLVLVGPSGSGKTTALRLLAGLEAISSGHVRIGDRIVDRVGPRDRNIAMVFQDYALYPQMTVFQNLAFGLRMAKVDRGEIERRVSDTAQMLGIDGLLARRPAELSGGQRQRVALGRALVRHPAVFLMDEPLSNLDAQIRSRTRGEIKQLQRALGTTTIYVTHDQIEAMTMGDRVAVMRDGILQQVAAPDVVYREPANVFVASFVGSPAMALNRVAAHTSGQFLELSHGPLRLQMPTMARGVPSEMILGVRPEHALLWSSEHGLIGPFDGEIESLEASGRETFLSVTMADDLHFVVRADGYTPARIGERIRFGVRSDRLYLFDKDGGQALTRS